MMTGQKVALASDHAGVSVKAEIKALLESWGYEALDLGPYDAASVDYPDYAEEMARSIAAGEAEQGILICGSGIGISIAANRFRHIRAALCHNETDARLSRLHNDANVIVLGARTMGIQVSLDCVSTFLKTEFEGGRHSRRVAKMS